MDANYKRDSLVGRVYFWYYGVAREERPSEEDSCHVGKVVLLYAPLAWFFVQPIFGTKIKPYMIVLAVAAVCFCIFLWKELLSFIVLAIIVGLFMGGTNLLKKGLGKLCRRLKPKFCRPVQWVD